MAVRDNSARCQQCDAIWDGRRKSCKHCGCRNRAVYETVLVAVGLKASCTCEHHHEFIEKNHRAIVLNIVIGIVAAIAAAPFNLMASIILGIAAFLICFFIVPPTVTKVREITKG